MPEKDFWGEQDWVDWEKEYYRLESYNLEKQMALDEIREARTSNDVAAVASRYPQFFFEMASDHEFMDLLPQRVQETIYRKLAESDEADITAIISDTEEGIGNDDE
jgi:hypothetical protein